MLYSSDMVNPHTIDDGICLREYRIVFPKNSIEAGITNEFTFNETINAVSYPSKFPDRIAKTTIEYQFE